jgi:Flp pilus assembly protein TadD
VTLRLGRQSIDIPAGDSRYVSADSFVLPAGVDVQAVQPHAHYRARDVRATATLPDGTTRWLLYIKDWDFKWQHVYRYVTPIALPKGTIIAIRYTYDNSSANPRNPQRPPQHVTWGQQSTKEMGDLWIQVVPRDDRDLQILKAAVESKMITEDIVGYETMIRESPSKPSLHDDVGVLYLFEGRALEAAAHFDASVRLRPDSATAHYNLGTALTAAKRLEEAAGQFLRALEIRPDYAIAHNNLGGTLVRLGKIEEALRHFREAVRLEPANAEFHYNAGTTALARGDVGEAIDHLQEAVRLNPAWSAPAAALARLLAAGSSVR